MTGGLLVAAAVAAGAPPAVVAATAVAVAAPAWFLGGAAVLAAVARVRRAGAGGADEEVGLLHGMAAELRAGASLRAALVAGAARAPGLSLGPALRLAAAGRPIAEVAAHVEHALPRNGRLAAAALELAASTGARSADLLTRLAAGAAAAGTLDRERHALTAQARLSALIVGGVPLAVAAVVTVAGAGDARHGTAGLAVVALGGSLVTLGGGIGWWMIRRAGR